MALARACIVGEMRELWQQTELTGTRTVGRAWRADGHVSPVRSSRLVRGVHVGPHGIVACRVGLRNQVTAGS